MASAKTTGAAGGDDKRPIRITVKELATLFGLGVFVGAGFCISRLVPRLMCMAMYMGLLSLFHATEFMVTAAYQPARATFESFLLDHSPEYSVSVLAAVVEHVAEGWLFPRLKSWLCILRLLGVVLALTGQAVRTLAMIEARDSFSHQIAEKKQPGHTLITTGIYRWVRHPSYLGFMLWALGTQLILGNPICLAAFAKVLLGFFEDRIQYEEETLVKFFQAEYTQYKAQTFSGFPTVA